MNKQERGFMQRIAPVILFILGASIIFYAFYKKEQPSAFHNLKTPATKAHSTAKHTPPHRDHVTHDPQMEKTYPKPAPAVYSASAPGAQTAVAHMNSLLKTYALGSFTLNDVIDDLEKRNMSPLLLKDSNVHTGTMYVLRTESPLPGTRYFHAQYFTDDKKEPYLQHMSFDVKPEKNAFQDAITTIKKIFGKLDAPTINKEGFIMWPWKNGYNIWVQKMDQEELSGDPYNAYAANDIGTVKIAVELDQFHDHSH